MVQWIVRSIPYDGQIELFLILARSSQCVTQRSWYVLSCLWDGVTNVMVCTNLTGIVHSKRSLAAN